MLVKENADLRLGYGSFFIFSATLGTVVKYPKSFRLF